MSREVADRIAAGMVAAWEHRVRHLDDHVVRSEGGIVTCLSNLPPAEQNVALVEREPRDALGSLSRAERLFEAHGRSFGIDVEAGRHPRMDRALRTFGLSLVVTRPAMAIRVDGLEPPVLPAGVEVRRVTGPDELRAVAGIETVVFGTEPAVAERLFSPGWLAVPASGSTSRPATANPPGSRGPASPAAPWASSGSGRCPSTGGSGSAEPSRRSPRARVRAPTSPGCSPRRWDGRSTRRWASSRSATGRSGFVHPAGRSERRRERPGPRVYSVAVAVLGGELAVPCTRNPLQRG